MQKIMKGAPRRARRVYWILAACALGIAFLAANSNRLRNEVVFYAWKYKQIEIHKGNAGNGLAPLPRQNPDYDRLVAIGRKRRPFLIEKLQRLSTQPYQDEAPYLSSLPQYVAIALVEASGWSREDAEKESKQYKSLADYVLARYKAESSTPTDLPLEPK